MPIELVALPDVQQTITRPATFEMANQIIEIAGLPKDTVIHYNGKRGTRATPGAFLSDNGEREAIFSSSNITFVSITEDYNTDAIQEIQPFSWDQRALFLDTKLGLSIRPVYIESSVSIEIIFRHSSETEVRRWLSTMYTKASAGRQVNLHSIGYSYPLPHEFFGHLLKDVHALREAVEPYGEDLETYFNKHRSARMETISNQIGEQLVFNIRERQSGIQGFFEIPTVPDKPEHLEELGLWQGTLVYKYSYHRPEQMLIQYPISVHNQYMPDKYLRNLNSVEDPYVRPNYFSFGQTALNQFSLDNQITQLRPPEPYIRIPIFDDFGENNHNAETIFPEATSTIFTALVFPDAVDKKTLCNLNELGDVFIDEDILDFLKSEAPYLNKLYHSVFHLNFFIDGTTRPYEEVEVLPDLTVKATRTLSMRSRYHIRLSLLPEINKPIYGALKRVAEHPKAFYKVVKGMNELFAIDPDFRNWENARKVEPWQFTAIYHALTGFSPGNAFARGADLTSYLTEELTTSQELYGLFRQLTPERIRLYLNDKRLRMKTVMTGFCVARIKDE